MLHSESQTKYFVRRCRLAAGAPGDLFIKDQWRNLAKLSYLRHACNQLGIILYYQGWLIWIDMSASPDPVILLALTGPLLGILAVSRFGWGRLVDKFRSDRTFNGEWIGWQWAKIGFASYKGCVWLGFTPEGLFVKTGPGPVFRLGHPPLYIPWHAVRRVVRRDYLFMKVMDLDLGDGLQITFKQDAMRKAEKWLPKG